MKTPIHSINIDFSHSSEAKALLEVIDARFAPIPDAEIYLSSICDQLKEAIELLESLEV
ncbi:hypothetical protein [Vibrio vulnificus]|uniref:Uncharacterized protein n=1 Tax=Vibrio vulnificus TaxID=672 RepID=A0AAW4HFU6_VIBVL|nr:hypothetical protein [Vibrio vulnificus]MBN8124098.1 hypothetical protein [Vibrio vulnificus]HDY8229003.1 hypothetical protein [Vibrio vulnificus]